jgi:hypothetical protein
MVADISSEESSKTYLGDALKTLQINTRTTVETQQDNITKYNLYNDGVTDPTPTNAISDTHLTSSNQYCGSNAESKFNCTTQDILQQFSDLKISNLTSGTNYGGSGRQTWAQAFLNNLVAPAPNSQFTIDSMTPAQMQDPNFQKAYVQALSAQPFISVGQQPFIDIMSRRIATGNNPSMMDQMEQGASSRFLNTTWVQSMAGVPGNPKKPPAQPQVVLLDMAQMLAFQIWLQYQQYLQMENIQATLGAMLIQNVRGAQAAQALINQGTSVQTPSSATPPPTSGTSQ